MAFAGARGSRALFQAALFAQKGRIFTLKMTKKANVCLENGLFSRVSDYH
jgi:hypothetical protein